MEPEDKKDKSEGYTEVFAWGADRYGQLGLGNRRTGGRCYAIPRFCTFNVVIRKVSCGEEHSAFITSNGNIFTMGSNADGRLGIGDRSLKLTPTPCLVEALSRFNAATVVCGWGHTAAVLDNGDLYTWGVGDYGALGISDCESQWFPVRVTFPDQDRVSVKSVSCGTRHTAIVDTQGRLFVCGAGDAGQLGTGSRERQPVPVRVDDIKEPVMQTACGIFHTLALTSAGGVFAMGGNNFGQLGTGTKRSSIVPVRVRALEKENVVKVAAGHISAALTDKGTVFVWGTGVFGEYLSPTPLAGFKPSSQIKDIDIGGNFGAAIDGNGVLYSWGSNASGELGLGDYEPRTGACQVHSLQGKPVTQIACGGSFTIALGKTVPHKYIPQPRPAREGLEKELEASMTPNRAAEARRFAPPESTTKSRIRDVLAEEEKARTGAQPRDISPAAPAPQRKPRENDELLDAYKAEQQRTRDLGRRVSELQEQSRNLQERIVTTEVKGKQKEQEMDKRYRDMLEAAERQLENERRKSAGLMKEFDGEKEREKALAEQQASLELRAKQLEDVVTEAKQENVKDREDRAARNVGESTRLSELLKDYEDRIEREIEDRRRVAREKANEIVALHGEISHVENALTAMQVDKARLSDFYKGEINKLETVLAQHKKELDDRLAERDRLLELKKSDEEGNAKLGAEIDASNAAIAGMEAEIRRLLDEIENNKRVVLDKENEIAAAKKGYAGLMEVLQEKEMQRTRDAAELKEREEETFAEAEKLRAALQEKVAANEELQRTMQAKAAEIDGRNKDVAAWTELANKIRAENTELKKNIEALELKNKKLLETMNLHMYNRAADYKERTIKALKASNSPLRVNKLRASGRKLRHVTPSPERFEKFLEEEKKTTESGVNNINQLTRFQADTVDNIKKNTELGTALANVERSQQQQQQQQREFDGKFVMDREDYKVEEDPRYVKSNYVLVQMLDEYDRPNHPALNVEAQSHVVRERFTTPKRQQQELPPEARTEARAAHKQVIQSTQQLLRILGTPTRPVQTGGQIRLQNQAVASQSQASAAAQVPAPEMRTSAYMTPSAAKGKGKDKSSATKSGITPSTAVQPSKPGSVATVQRNAIIPQ